LAENLTWNGGNIPIWFFNLQENVGKRISTIGEVNDYVRHARDAIISPVASNPRLRKELSKYEIEFFAIKIRAAFHTFLDSSTERFRCD